MKTFKTDFCDYKVISTDDNSETLYSEGFDENCHSLAGARSETLHNYIFGCQINRFCQKMQTHQDLSILEVGFGLGVGLLTTLDYLKEQEFSKKLHFLSVEIDAGLVEYTIGQNLKQYPFLENLTLIKRHDIDLYFYEDESFLIEILIGDATSTLPLYYAHNTLKKFSAIFQDAFSPRKNPILWTKEWFETLFKLSDSSTILATYSSAGLVKKNLSEAGFEINTIKGYHLKKTITIARCKDNS